MAEIEISVPTAVYNFRQNFAPSCYKEIWELVKKNSENSLVISITDG